jgi:hypothetical protein
MIRGLRKREERPRSSLTIVAEIGDLNTIDGLPETLAKAIINAIGV